MAFLEYVQLTLCGTGIFIPRSVSDILGYWSEEYGLYGAEDGDYGARMQAAGLKQYYYHGPDYFRWDLDSSDEAKYIKHGLNKQREHKRLFIEKDGTNGLFRVNYTLYKYCIRSFRVERRYKVVDVDKNCRVTIEEREEYAQTVEALSRCKRLLDTSLLGRETLDITEIEQENLRQFSVSVDNNVLITFLLVKIAGKVLSCAMS